MPADEFEKKGNQDHVSDSKATDKNRSLIIIIAVVILLIGAGAFFVFKPFQTKSPIQIKSPTQNQNKAVKNSSSKFSKTNPFKAKVNPFKDIKTNPFR